MKINLYQPKYVLYYYHTYGGGEYIGSSGSTIPEKTTVWKHTYGIGRVVKRGEPTVLENVYEGSFPKPQNITTLRVGHQRSQKTLTQRAHIEEISKTRYIRMRGIRT